MKQPPINLEMNLKASYINKLAFVRKFIRYWGTTTITDYDNGNTPTKVFIGRKYYYKRSRMSSSTKKLLKMLKLYNTLTTQKMEGIKKAWVYLNPNGDGVPNFSSTIVAENFDNLFGDNDYIELTLLLGPKVDRTGNAVSSKVSDYPLNTPVNDIVGVTNELINEYRSNFVNGYICDGTSTYVVTENGVTEVLQGSPYSRLLARYVIDSDEVPWEITKVEEYKSEVSVPYSTYYYDYSTSVSGTKIIYRNEPTTKYRVKLKVPRFNFNENTDIVQQIVNDAGASNVNAYITSKILGTDLDKYIQEEEDDFSTRDVVFFLNPKPLSNPDFWVLDKDDKSWGGYLLKTEVLTGNLLTLDQKIELINSILDVDYKEKESSAWDNFVALVISAVVVYVAYQICGGACAGNALTLTTATVYVAAVALTLSLATLAAQGMGMEGLASALGQYAKMMNTLATMLAILSLITTGLGGNPSTVGGGEAGTSLTLEQVGGKVIDNITTQIKELVTSSFTDISFEQFVKVSNQLFGLWSENQTKNIQDKIRKEESKAAKLRQDKEEQQATNVWLQFGKVQFDLLRSDYSYYASIYDKPYEGWMSTMHTGNIQRTEVSALWTKDKMV